MASASTPRPPPPAGTRGLKASHERWPARGGGARRAAARNAETLVQAILERRTHAHGQFHPAGLLLGTFARQLRKYSRDARDELRGRLTRSGTGRDLGYPGAQRRPPQPEHERIEALFERGEEAVLEGAANVRDR